MSCTTHCASLLVAFEVLLVGIGVGFLWSTILLRRERRRLEREDENEQPWGSA